MTRILTAVALLILTGCGGWGGYIHQSEKFKFEFIFPDGWEVWDKSDDRRDFLQAMLDGSQDAKIEVTALPTAPDISVNEVYPFFLEGSGDAAELQDFQIEERGMVPASNGEGRFIKVKWTGEKKDMRGYRALFLGNRYRLDVRAEMTEEEFLKYEQDMSKMIKHLKL
jgi:hypothetical protein